MFKPHNILIVTCCHMYKITRQVNLQQNLINPLLSKYPNTIYYFIVADPNQLQEFVVHGNTLSVKTNDDYLGLPKKLFMAFKYVHLHFPKHGIVKIDDDCTQSINQIISQLKADLTPIIYTGNKLVDVPKAKRDIHNTCLAKYYLKYHPQPLFTTPKTNLRGKRNPCSKLVSHDGKYVVTYTGKWYDGGSGYSLSNVALQLIVQRFSGNPDNIKDIYEDKLWADVLRRHC